MSHHFDSKYISLRCLSVQEFYLRLMSGSWIFLGLFEAFDGGGHALILNHDSRINQHKDWDQPLFVTKCPDLQIKSVILYGQCPFYLYVGPKSRINLSLNSYHNTYY